MVGRPSLRPSVGNYAQWILHIPFFWAYSPMHISEGTLETRNTVRLFIETTVCSVGMRSHFNWLIVPHVPFHPREQTPSGVFCGGQENSLCSGVITTHNFLPNESCPSSLTSIYPTGRTLTHMKTRPMWIWDFITTASGIDSPTDYWVRLNLDLFIVAHNSLYTTVRCTRNGRGWFRLTQAHSSNQAHKVLTQTSTYSTKEAA